MDRVEWMDRKGIFSLLKWQCQESQRHSGPIHWLGMLLPALGWTESWFIYVVWLWIHRVAQNGKDDSAVASWVLGLPDQHQFFFNILKISDFHEESHTFFIHLVFCLHQISYQKGYLELVFFSFSLFLRKVWIGISETLLLLVSGAWWLGCLIFSHGFGSLLVFTKVISYA